jgi:hypothetical protein
VRENVSWTAIRAKTLWGLVGLRDAQQILGVLPFLDNGRTYDRNDYGLHDQLYSISYSRPPGAKEHIGIGDCVR